MKKIIVGVLFIVVLLSFTGCGAKRAIHCDSCGCELSVGEKSNVEEDWIIYCDACHDELWGDDPILGNN